MEFTSNSFRNSLSPKAPTQLVRLKGASKGLVQDYVDRK